MATKQQTLGDLGDGPFVVAMVSREDNVIVRKGRIPRKRRGDRIETLPTISYKMNSETGATALDRWVGPFVCGTTLLVVHKYTRLVPTSVLCMMHPDVQPCKLDLTAEDQTGTFEALIGAGLPPNDMREVMRDQVAKSRLAFFTAFRAALVSVPTEDRARMFKGCEDLLLSVVRLHAGTPEAMVAQQELVLRTQRETLMVGCLTPDDFETWGRQHTQKHQWPDVLRPEVGPSRADRPDACSGAALRSGSCRRRRWTGLVRRHRHSAAANADVSHRLQSADAGKGKAQRPSVLTGPRAYSTTDVKPATHPGHRLCGGRIQQDPRPKLIPVHGHGGNEPPWTPRSSTAYARSRSSSCRPGRGARWCTTNSAERTRSRCGS